MADAPAARGLTTTERAILAGVVLATIAAGVTRYVHGVSEPLAFAVSAIALAGLAWLVSFATEQLGARFGAPVTGVLQSTLGNRRTS